MSKTILYIMLWWTCMSKASALKNGGGKGALSFKCSGSISSTFKKRLELVQIQIIHRHGDRTPITPMKDKDFWKNSLPSPVLLSKISEGTIINRANTDGSKVAHQAAGKGVFGKLTKLGLLQMVEVGSRIHDDIQLTQEDGTNTVDEDGNLHVNSGYLFTDTNPIHPSKVKIKSTDFPRTIQSVQALLMGLFPLGYDGHIEIDVSHTDIMIPDPQPRLSNEQVELERRLSQRGYLLEKEKELETLANKITKELHDIVDLDNAQSANFGIGEEGDHKRARALSFSQLSEIMTCLHVRDMLPQSISQQDYEAISSHSAWKWFENLKDEALAKLAMKGFMNFIMETLRDGRNDEDDPVLHIYSCHDSSLIGLLCAFKLEPPSQWPEYGSFLKVELFKAEETIENSEDVKVDYFVRFSLNGEILKSSWNQIDGSAEGSEPEEMICLKQLSGSIARKHGHECIL